MNARTNSQGCLWVVRSNENSFLIYFQDSAIVAGASCVWTVALPIFETERILMATRRGTKGIIASDEQESVDGD